MVQDLSLPFLLKQQLNFKGKKDATNSTLAGYKTNEVVPADLTSSLYNTNSTNDGIDSWISKDIIKKVQRQSMKWEKILENIFDIKSYL